MRSNQEQETYLSYPKTLEFVGDQSTYQKRLLLYFSFWEIVASFYIMGLPFLTLPNKYLCQLNDTYFECSQFYAYNYGFEKIDNKSLFNYLDQNNIYASCALASCMFLGMLLSNFDRFIKYYGIRKLLILSLNMQILSLSFLQFPNIHVQMISSFVFGFGFAGFQLMSKKAIRGVSNFKFQNYHKIVQNKLFTFGQIIFNPLSYFMNYINSQKIMILFIVLPMIYLMIKIKQYYIECPYYLLNQKQFENSKINIKQIAKINDRKEFDFLYQEEIQQYQENKFLNQKLYSFIDFIKYRSLRTKTISLFIIIMNLEIIDYGIIYSIYNYGPEVYQNWLLISMSGILAGLMSQPMTQKMSQNRAITIFLLIPIAINFLTIFIKVPYYCFDQNISCVQEKLVVFSAMLTRFSIFIIKDFIFNHCQECFPKNISVLGNQIVYKGGQFGLILMPIIVLYYQINNAIILPFFGLLCLINLIFSVNLRYEDPGDQIQEVVYQQQAIII